MLTSDAIDKIAPAFVKAQAECDGAKKSSENAQFKNNGRASKYADLTAVWDACQGALEANGLAVVQGLGEVVNGAMHMDTMILHTSGQWLKAHSSIPLTKNDPQGYGSATTYLRRYALAAMMGIVQEDDDGNAASQPVRQAAKSATIDDGQRAQLMTLLEQSGADTAKFLSFYGVQSLPDLPADRFGHAQAQLLKKLNTKAEGKAA